MIMKLAMPNNRVLMAILVIASIGGTLAIVQGLNLDGANKPITTGGAMLSGNVKVIQYDKSGNIIAYRQTDNHIVLSGMELIMAQVFGGMNSTAAGKMSGLDSSKTHPVRFMQIGTGGQNRLLFNDTDIYFPIGGCTRQLATIDNATYLDGPAHKYPGLCVAPNCSAQMNVTAVASFAGATCTALSIDEAGIYDNATTSTVGHPLSNGGGLMFARNTFGSVDLGVLDTLQLQWEFTFTDS